jgi:hypothetical protein
MRQRDLRAIYGRAFFAEQIDGSARSAKIVVPLVMQMVRDVRSVVDVGCGAGTWLARFKEAGVQRGLGFDGGAAAEHDQIEIEPEEFRVANPERDIDPGGLLRMTAWLASPGANPQGIFSR